MAAANDVARYEAFLHQLANNGSMIIVRELNGVKFFQWISLKQLKLELGL